MESLLLMAAALVALGGALFHAVVDPANPPNPLPEQDEVAMSCVYPTGIGHWSARFPYRQW